MIFEIISFTFKNLRWKIKNPENISSLGVSIQSATYKQSKFVFDTYTIAS